jgi:FkbM family methyltransferase
MTKRSPLKVESLAILKERGVPVGTIIDVGILSGTPELIRAWPEKKHILFEPVEEFSQIIQTAYSNVDHELHHSAVSDSSGSVGLELRSVIQGMPISHSGMTENAVQGDGRVVRQVPMIALDDFLHHKEYEEPFLLKIDIDGHELRVLKGAKKTLQKCSIVIVECPKSQLVERISAVQAAGFDLFDLCEPCYYDKAFWQCDGVFLRSDLHKKYFTQLTSAVDKEKYEMFH